MRNDRERSRNRWSSLIGWLIFILIIAARPIFGLLQSLFGGSTALSPNVIPILIGVLVVLSVIVSALRAAGGSARSRGDTRLPTGSSPPPSQPSAPMPPFGGGAASSRGALPPRSSPRAFTLPASSGTLQTPPPPRFEPVFNPTILMVGILGLLALGAMALFVLLGSTP